MTNKEITVTEPQSELGKLILALMYATVDTNPNAFKKINILKALEEADHADCFRQSMNELINEMKKDQK